LVGASRVLRAAEIARQKPGDAGANTANGPNRSQAG
jgi:hypothetical protein